MKRWIQCRDYSNGGPTFEPFTGGASLSASSDLDMEAQAFKILAVYTEKSNVIAALKCSIGEGVALLVGTHPELDPEWLVSQRDSVAIDQGLKDKSDQERRDEDVGAHVKAQLERCSAERKLYMDMLLCEAGLSKYLQ